MKIALWPWCLSFPWLGQDNHTVWVHFLLKFTPKSLQGKLATVIPQICSISAQLFPSWPASPVSSYLVTENATTGIPDVKHVGWIPDSGALWISHPFLSRSFQQNSLLKCLGSHLWGNLNGWKVHEIFTYIAKRATIMERVKRNWQSLALLCTQSNLCFPIFSANSRPEQSTCAMRKRDISGPFRH